VLYEIDIVSAHRTPEKLHEYASSAESRGIKVIIAVPAELPIYPAWRPYSACYL
jgi:phosphoribosylcarboxyaminoimidazole (NCAIR) mutase